MAKTLDFAYGTPHEVKVGDDETTFTLVCKNEDLLVDLTTAKSITAKIGNSSGYLREQLINIDSLAKLPTGQFKFNFDKDTLANFPTGNYFLEVWVTDDQGTSIYPSGSPLNFTVTTNIENSSGASITTIAFDDFVEAMNKAASTIAKGDKGDTGPRGEPGQTGPQGVKGDKGDTGTVDNAGLTTAPAFVELKTQVDNKVTDNKDGSITVNGKTFVPADKASSVQTADMRKPASDVAGIEEVNAKQDKIDYTPADDSKVVHLSTGATSNRPTGQVTGYQYFDITLNKPVWYTGTAWVDATGTTV